MGVELKDLEETARTYKESGIGVFGTTSSQISWGPLAGDQAVIRDCMDQSRYGTFDIKSNKALTIGTTHVRLDVTFKKIASKWLVSFIVSPKGATC